MIHIFIPTVELQEYIFVLREMLASEAHQLKKKIGGVRVTCDC